MNVDDDEDSKYAIIYICSYKYFLILTIICLFKESLFSTLFGIAWLGMIGYILYNMYLSCMRTRRGNNRNNR